MFNEESVFGCGTIELKDLRKLHEKTKAKKLRLGSKFLRAALCSRKNEVGIGLIKPKTEVATQVCKLHVGNVRGNTKKCEIINM